MPAQLLLFGKMPNLIHSRGPIAKKCFNTTVAASAEAAQSQA